MALLTRLLIFFLPDFMVGNIVHNTVFNMPDRNPIYHFYGMCVTLKLLRFFPCAYFGTLKPVRAYLAGYVLSSFFIWPNYYFIHSYIPPTYGTLTLFRAPLLGLLPTMLFSDFQNFFLAYVSASRLSVRHLRLNIPHSHRNFHGNAFSTNGNIDIGLLFPVVFSFLDSDCHEPHFSPVW